MIKDVFDRYGKIDMTKYKFDEKGLLPAIIQDDDFEVIVVLRQASFHKLKHVR